ITDPLTSLVKKLDVATRSMSDRAIDSYLIFPSNDASLETRLKDLITKEPVNRTAISMADPKGPPGFKLDPNADVTLAHFVRQTAQAVSTFKKDELKPEAVERIIDTLDLKTEKPFQVGQSAPVYRPKNVVKSEKFGADRVARGPKPCVIVFARSIGDP